MLGWEIFISRKAPTKSEAQGSDTVLASWLTGFNGCDWIRRLVKDGRAMDLGSNGVYPHAYSAKAKEILPIILALPKTFKGSIVVGEDYVHLGGFKKTIKINQSVLDQCSPG